MNDTRENVKLQALLASVALQGLLLSVLFSIAETNDRRIQKMYRRKATAQKSRQKNLFLFSAV